MNQRRLKILSYLLRESFDSKETLKLFKKSVQDVCMSFLPPYFECPEVFASQLSYCIPKTKKKKNSKNTRTFFHFFFFFWMMDGMCGILIEILY